MNITRMWHRCLLAGVKSLVGAGRQPAAPTRSRSTTALAAGRTSRSAAAVWGKGARAHVPPASPGLALSLRKERRRLDQPLWWDRLASRRAPRQGGPWALRRVSPLRLRARSLRRDPAHRALPASLLSAPVG